MDKGLNSFEELKEDLKITCGFTCYLDPDNCDCFGVWDKETRDEVGVDDYDEEVDPFYSIEECLHFQNMAMPTHWIMKFPYEHRLKHGVPDFYDLSPLKLLEKK